MNRSNGNSNPEYEAEHSANRYTVPVVGIYAYLHVRWGIDRIVQVKQSEQRCSMTPSGITEEHVCPFTSAVRLKMCVFFFTLFELTGFNFHTHLVHNMIGMALSVIVVCPVKWGHRQSPVYPPYLWSSPSVSVRLSGSVSLHSHHSTVWASGGF